MGTPETSIWAAIPVKPFDIGKSRLGLVGDARTLTNRAFLDHVLGVAGAVLPTDHIVIVSHDEAALAVAHGAGAHGLREPEGGGLNEALTAAAAFAAGHGATAVLSLFADLPELAPEDLRAMIAAFAGDNLVIAPDDKDSGSNALLMRPNALPYRHGPDSLSRHLDAARMAHVAVSVIRRPGLMRDVDTPAQYSAVASGSRPDCPS